MNLQSRFLVTTFLLAAVLFPTTAQAVGFMAFERMSLWAQSEFVAVMIDTTEKALKDDGRADFAAKMEHLFTTVEPGDSMSLGLVEYVRNEALARVDDAKHASEHPNDPRLEVEDALFVTLKKNGIVMSNKAMDAVDRSMANFHAETYAEFEAKSLAQQRRFIALLFRFAWPDYVFRDDVHSRIESHKGGMFSDPDRKRDMLTLVNTQFPPQSTDQPGFAGLAKEIEAGYKKSPDKDGPFFEITIYVLRQLDAQIVKKMDAMDAHTLLLPGGRHIYKADNGDLWAVKKGSPDTKLDEHDTELANRISDCMTRRGISNGPDGLAACRDEVGIPRDDSTSPAPSTSDIDTSNAKGRANMLQWVREDTAEYINASRTGFEAYKSGKDYQVSAGYRTWESSVKPMLAKGCWVVQGTAATTTTFSCLLAAGPDLNSLRSYYTQITEDVTASLPADWTPDAAPPFGPEYPASKSYRSSSGAHGEVWLANAPSGGGYELHYELVSAPSAPKPMVNPPAAKPSEDDPIGQGGFITPPDR